MRLVIFLLALATTLTCAASDVTQLAGQVRDAETAFAASMARRDLQAFATHLADDAVFFSSDSEYLRGKAAIVEGWKKFYTGAKAPFSWRPENVVVLESGTLAHSSGPVFDAEGRRSGTFNSVWRRTGSGTWQVVFDKGCNCRDTAKKD